MRLKHIKLAGFKSFVDPTKVPFEQQMTAIVGPNGCGKSNIIDAVRWVLGESSAKNLRGDAMTDVIFNGAASRKPIGQASVELVFDNIDGRIQGSMADRNEISIRRLVNRESTNTYFLNGTKCRRRDITDIFLGTGLGPRSYAIIEQGTISRLIESKPHELRVFIEEAAGISKYKERRKDTENRIRHTRENLSRLSDIRAELSLQIDKLHKQSEAAKRYRTLKTQERKYKAELTVLRWQAFNEQSQKHQKNVETAKAEIDVLTQQQEQHSIELFQAKQKVELGGLQVSDLQNTKIELTNNIARTEQNIKHLKQQSVTITDNNKITQQQLLNAQEQLKTEQEKRTSLEQKIANKAPLLANTEKEVSTHQNLLETLSAEQNEVQAQWKAVHEKTNELAKQKSLLLNKIELEQQKHQQTQAQVLDYQNQLLALVSELDKYKPTEQVNNVLVEQVANLQHTLKKNAQTITNHQNNISELQQLLASKSASLSGFNNNLAHIEEQLVVKENWQVEQHEQLIQLSQSVEKSESLITQSSINTLIENLTIEQGWEQAIESVLSYWQNAELVTSIDNIIDATENLSKVLFIEENSCADIVPGTLAEKLTFLPNALVFLNHIITADNVKTAQQQLKQLSAHQSIICKNTTWIGKGFVRKGLFEQSNDFLKLSQQKDKTLVSIHNLQQTIEQSSLLLAQNQQASSSLQTAQNNLQAELKQRESQLQEQKQEQAIIRQKYDFYTKQQQQVQQQCTQKQTDLAAFEQSINRLNNELANLNESRGDNEMPQSMSLELTLETINNKQTHIQAQFQSTQKQLKFYADERQQLAVSLEQLKNEKEQSSQTIKSAQQSIERLTEQQVSNTRVIDNCAEPLKLDESNLVKWLQEMVDIDEKIQHAQQNIANAHTTVTAVEIKQKSIQEKTFTLRETSSKHHLEGESFKLRAETALESLQDTQFMLNEVLTNMPKNAKEGIWQAHIIRLSKDIGALGAINLAAIDEYETQLTRKNYLDSQNDDLQLAISTLESAIEKIDKESRQKFKATFEQVNKDLKILFPKVFGGGRAYLELTGTDMLDTGVTIMAQPPGKKNSTIHLLSGGEKALTALSLVFAIFRLNPAPFCMLDEVDAPLDDANVSRFCNLVREMSRTVQFIYISHNKIAMEMASHLTGVTMFEPGVSKMVAVDIEEAVAMAELS